MLQLICEKWLPKKQCFGAGSGAARSRPFWLEPEPEPKKLRSFGSGSDSIIKEDEWNQNCNFLKFLIIIVEIIFGVKKIKMFILVDPSRLENKFFCCCYEFIVFCLTIHQEPEPEPFYFWTVGARAGAAGNRAAPKPLVFWYSYILFCTYFWYIPTPLG